MPDLQDLEIHLRQCFPLLLGDWVGKQSDYEIHFAQIIGAELSSREEARHWDCRWKGIRLELKKGNIWLDVVRYIESLLAANLTPPIEIVTLFLARKENRVSRIDAVTQDDLISLLRLTPEIASLVLRVRDEMPRSLNVQAGLAASDVRGIAKFSITE